MDTLKSNDTLTIAHISDIHAGSGHFDPDLLEQAIAEINKLDPQIVLVSGDLTNDGFLYEYREAKGYLDAIECENIALIPGNHDSRNVGYVHFEDLFGPRSSVVKLPGVTLVALDSTAPDLDIGRLGRQNYGWISERFDRPDDLKLIALHHHLLPIPGTGRERNLIEDAGDFLKLLVETSVDIVLSGHKHVPYNWKFETLYVLNAGTVSSHLVRGYAQPCYSIIRISGDRCLVYWQYPAGKRIEVASYPLKKTAVLKNSPL